MPFVNPPKTTGYLIGFAAATLLVWAFSVALLYGNERPPAMRAMAPIAWGVTTFVWPGLVGLLLCLLVAKAGFTLKFAGAALVVGVFVLPVAVITCMHVGAALSMRPPWIKGIDADFRGMRSPWVWLGLALTILLNVGLARGKVNDFEGWFVSEESQSAPSRPSVVQGPFRTPEAASEGQGSRAVSQPVPSAAGYVTDVTGAVPADEVAYLAARLEILAKAGVATRVLVVSSTASEDIESFARRVGNTWNEQSAASRSDLLVVVATADRRVRVEVTRDFNDRFTDADAAGLIDLGFRPEAGKAGVGAGLRTLVDRLERTIAARETATASDEDLRARALAAVAMTVAGVGTWDGRQPTLAPAAQAMLDSAKARLEAMPRPARGDRKAARQLHAGGLTLLRASGFEALAVEKLRRAAAADPLDVQILNDLAYAEHRAGEHRAALEHLILTLRLAPDRTSAWVNFAETQTFTTASSEEAVRTASDLYLTGYWFSGDRLKALDYLRERSIAPDASDEVRAAAASTLHRLGSVQDNAASGPGTSTSPSEPRTHEAPLGDTQDQTRQGANSITGRRVINEPRPTGGHKAGEVDTGEQAKAELAPRLSLDVEQRVTRDTAFAKAAEAVKVVADMVIESMQSDTGTLLSSGQLLRDPRILEAIRTRDAAVASVSRDPQTSFTALTKARDLAAQHGSSQQVLQLLEHAVEGDPFNVATLDSVSLILWRIGKLQNAADVAAWRYSIDPLQPAALIRWMEVASISGEMPTDKAGALMAWAYALSGQDPLVRDRLKEIGDSGAKEGTAAEAARLAVAIIYSWEMQGRSRAGSRRQS